MAPAIFRSLFGANVPVQVDTGAIGPLAARAVLTARDMKPRADGGSGQTIPAQGAIDPHNINNQALFAVFGFIGAALVILGIWFFFWAKNGGIYFKENDWDEYKSTVLRRRGPNGTLLSGATPSTNLGGGSIYKDVDDRTTTVSGASSAKRDKRERHHDDDGRTEVTDTTYMTGITAGVSNIGAREQRRRKKEARDRDRERRREEKAAAAAEKEAAKKKDKTRKLDANGKVIDEAAEAEAKEHLRSYRHERPARVGGLNKEAEGSQWDGSTNPSNSSAGGGGSHRMETVAESDATSDLLSNRQRTPTSTPTKKNGGIRKVYSTADRNAEREAERIRAEARRLQEKGRAAMSTATAASASSSSSAAAAAASPRRDFSFQRADDHRLPMKRIAEVAAAGGDDGGARVPGSWTESDVGSGTASEVGTKTYHHPIPELSSSLSGSGVATNDFAYQDEKRKQRRAAGYRRG